MNVLRFANLLANTPSEAYGRLEGVLDSRLERFWLRPQEYKAATLETILTELGVALGADVQSMLAEQSLAEVEAEVLCGIREMPDDAPFGLFENADLVLARLCYVLVRVLRPLNVLETGVCYGVTTSFILQALRMNGSGMLHSIDLPPLGARASDFVGWLVPARLKDNWRLHCGASKILLRKSLKQLDRVGVFVHDSLHTYRNMRRELNLITPHLASAAAVISDDIEGNPAFARWASEVRPSYCGVVSQGSKNSLLGVALLLNRPPS
jgi:hypothetical protein